MENEKQNLSTIFLRNIMKKKSQHKLSEKEKKIYNVSTKKQAKVRLSYSKNQKNVCEFCDGCGMLSGKPCPFCNGKG